MPIKIPNTLPAVEVLNRENIFIMREARAQTQDIRPLRIALVNLMPDKITTETQFARLLSNTPLQIEKHGARPPQELLPYLLRSTRSEIRRYGDHGSAR